MKLFAQDKANHYAYGSWAALGAAMVALVAGLSVAGYALATAAGVAAMAAISVAGAAGAWKEARDDLANAEALARGESPPHDVSRNDLIATLLGALPVAAPLLLLAALA
jgi:hypothetical protein